MRHPGFDANALCETLDGSCDTLDSCLDTLWPGMNSLDFAGEDWDFINNTTFHCETCGCWYGVDCWSDEDDMCSDCYETKNE
jgi:hypothetical protein